MLLGRKAAIELMAKRIKEDADLWLEPDEIEANGIPQDMSEKFAESALNVFLEYSVNIWQPIETRPTGVGNYVVLLPGNDVCDALELQVSNYEGQIYPSHQNALSGYDDRITTATHWRFCHKL